MNRSIEGFQKHISLGSGFHLLHIFIHVLKNLILYKCKTDKAMSSAWLAEKQVCAECSILHTMRLVNYCQRDPTAKPQHNQWHIQKRQMYIYFALFSRNTSKNFKFLAITKLFGFDISWQDNEYIATWTTTKTEYTLSKTYVTNPWSTFTQHIKHTLSPKST